MFVAVWMLYAADRLLDARAFADGGLLPGLEERHRFHHLHRRAFLTGIVVASGVLSVLLHELDPRALHLYAILATLLATWLLLVHARPFPSADAHRLPKELAVGIFFPAAIFIPSVARAPELRNALLPPALLFAAVCALNCLFLYSWEHPGETRHAHWTTRWAARRLPTLSSLVTIACLAFASLSFQIPPLFGALPRAGGPFLLALACALSASLLLLLHVLRDRLSALTLRAAADLVLLTPLLCLPLLRFVSR